MKYSVIIVNYKTDDYVINCIESLQRHCSRHQFEVIVVDNGSNRAGFASRLISLEVRHHDAGGNVGFGRACNIGASIAYGDLLVFVNPDIVFIGDALALLAEGFQNAGEQAIVGLNLCGEDGLPSYAGGRFPSLALEFMELFYAHRWMRHRHAQLAVGQTYPDCPEIKEVDYVCGALFGTSRETFGRLGGFNPGIFLYFEETELMFRHRQMGGSVQLMCKVTAVHKGSVSTVANSDFKLHHMEFGRRVFYSTRYKGICRSLTRIVRGLRLLMLFLTQRRSIYVRLIPTAILGRLLPHL